MDAAFEYEEQASVCTEQSYPYTAEDGSCTASSCTVGIPDHDVTGHLDFFQKTTEERHEKHMTKRGKIIELNELLLGFVFFFGN